MSAFHGLWGGLAAAALALTVVFVVGTAVAVTMLIRLRSDMKRLEAAERFEPVDASYLVMKHVPAALRTGLLSNELPIVRERVGRKIVTRNRIAAGLAALAIVVGVLGYFAVRHSIMVADAELASSGDLSAEVMKLIQGVWGWKYDFERSCSRNPHTITVSDGGDKLVLTFQKPYWSGRQEIQTREFKILTRNKRGLTLALAGERVRVDPFGQPIVWNFVFLDRDTYSAKRSDAPQVTTGDIIRCPAGTPASKPG